MDDDLRRGDYGRDDDGKKLQMIKKISANRKLASGGLLSSVATSDTIEESAFATVLGRAKFVIWRGELDPSRPEAIFSPLLPTRVRGLRGLPGELDIRE